MLLPQLRRVRWAVRATLVLGVAASVVANVLHALDNPISQAIAAWPPLALLLTVELISRVPVHHKSLAFCRLLATAIIAGIAAWVSYWHMVGVAARYGETGASPYLLPLSVDGLIVVASICLVELGGQITTLEVKAQAATQATATFGTAAEAGRATTTMVAEPPARGATRAAPVPPQRQPATVPGLIPVPANAAGRRSTADAMAEVKAALTKAEATPPFTPAVTTSARAATPARRSTAATAKSATAAEVTKSVAGSRPRRSPAETVAAAAKIKKTRPEITETDLAADLGISVARWRTVRREAEALGENLRLAA